MELNQMRTLQLVAARGSFSRAAVELHLTQPAVTRQIKNLELELGELLLERLGRSVVLTPAGEALLTYVDQILNLNDQAGAAIRQFAKERGRLSIGAGTTNTIFRLPEILQQYHQRHPQVEVRIRSGDSELITRLVLENAVDLGLVTTIDPLVPLAALPLFTDQIWLVTPPNYPRSLTAVELASEALILFRAGSGFRRFVEEGFRRHHFTPRVALELESIEAIIRMVQSGLGLAFLPEVAVRQELAAQTLRRVTVSGWEPWTRQTYLIHRRAKYLTWPVQAFLKLVQEKE